MLMKLTPVYPSLQSSLAKLDKCNSIFQIQTPHIRELYSFLRASVLNLFFLDVAFLYSHFFHVLLSFKLFEKCEKAEEEKKQRISLNTNEK